jgi:hypothetical protein
MQIRPIIVAPVLLLAVGALITQAQARNRFAMTCIENKTNQSLRYKTKWGAGDSWDRHVIQPGNRTSHTYELSGAGTHPILYVTFDDDLSGRMKMRDYRLKSYASPQKTNCKRYGKEYHFRYDGSAKKYIDIVGIR